MVVGHARRGRRVQALRTVRTALGRGGMTPPVQPKLQGAPLDLTDEALDQAAQVTPVDVALAKAVWAHHALKGLADLLDASRKENDQWM